MSTYHHLPTVTIGIPAHNEGQNISRILSVLLNQLQSNYQLKKILIYCDGCTDNTLETVQEISRKDHRVCVHNNQHRKGKIAGLEYIFKQNSSEFIVCFDADALPANRNVVSNLISKFTSSKVAYIGGNGQPASARTHIESLINHWYKVWYETRRHIKNGDSPYNLSGCCFALRSEFAESITFPTNIVSEVATLYFTTKSRKLKFIFCPEAVTIFRSPATLQDYLLRTKRSPGGRHRLADYFGHWVYSCYYIPQTIKITTFIKMMILHPLLTPAAALFAALISLLPPPSRQFTTSHYWEMVPSTKIAI